MSWYGTHPVYSKEWIKTQLPAGACKRCVYWERVFRGERLRSQRKCPRCGVGQKALVERKLNGLVYLVTVQEFLKLKKEQT